MLCPVVVKLINIMIGSGMGPGIYSCLFFTSRRCFGISNNYNQFAFIRATSLSMQHPPASLRIY